jgi:ATP-dependent Clp protease, protease subunit
MIGVMCQAICHAPLHARSRSRNYTLAINEIPMAEIQQTRSFDNLIASHLFRSRTVLVTGEVNATMAERVIAQLFALADASEDPVLVVISSPGGHVESGDMIHDALRFIRPRVRVLGSGWVASAGALIYIGAKKGDRYALPNTRFLLHEPSGGIGGHPSDIFIQAREITIMRERLNKLLAAATGQDIAKIEKDTARDFWLTGQEAKDYGL